jgi:hypothetical protein
VYFSSRGFRVGGTGNWLPEGQEVFHQNGVSRTPTDLFSRFRRVNQVEQVHFGVNFISLNGGVAHDLLLLRNTGNQLPVPPRPTVTNTAISVWMFFLKTWPQVFLIGSIV